MSNEGNRLLSGVLVFTGILGLVGSVYISARFGWSLADDPSDRAVTAGILGLADFASAVLIVAASRMRTWGWYRSSYSAVAVAAIFVSMGFLSAYGFFSNRISVHEAQKSATAVDRGYVEWLKRQTVNTSLSRTERSAMRAEVKAANTGLKTSMSVVSDRQAAAIGAWLGWTIEQTQTRLTAATAAIAYAVKFSGLWFGVMLWPHRRKDAEANQKTQSGSAGGEPRKPTLVHPAPAEPPKPAAIRTMEDGSPDPAPVPARTKLNGSHRPEPPKVSSAKPRVLDGLPAGKLSPYDRAYELALANPHWSTRKIADRADCSQTTSARVKKRVRSKSDSIIRRFAGNGGGYHLSASG